MLPHMKCYMDHMKKYSMGNAYDDNNNKVAYRTIQFSPKVPWNHKMVYNPEVKHTFHKHENATSSVEEKCYMSLCI